MKRMENKRSINPMIRGNKNTMGLPRLKILNDFSFLKLGVFILVLFCSKITAQNVTIQNNKFKLNGNDFYPMVINYNVRVVNNNGNFFVSPDFAYNVQNDFECNDVNSCASQMQTDFNYISSMGFNTVRIAGISPKYIAGQGLVQSFVDHNIHSGPSGDFEINPYNLTKPGLLRLFGIYNEILKAAAQATPKPLKVIFIMLSDQTDLNPIHLGLQNDFLNVLSAHFSSAPNNSALLAYDLINEPSNGVKPPITKQSACSTVETWYNTIKANDPNHLVTIGLHGAMDVYMFDPAMLKVDFHSIHVYPDFRPTEDKTQAVVQENARKRLACDLYWFQHATNLPWIIGETGFAARWAGSASSTSLDGSINSMTDYINFSLHASCNCGSSGYSWWNYQEQHHYGPTHAKFGQDSYGLLKFGYAPSLSAEKPGVYSFKNYVPKISGPCPAEYTPTYDATKTFYNRFAYPPYPQKEIGATIIDQLGNPVKNAVVQVIVKYSLIETDGFTTYTDENGYFKVIPLSLPSSPPPMITFVKISAPEAEIIKWYNPSGVNIPNTSTIQKSNYNTVLPSTTLFAGTNAIYSAKNNLVVTNAIVHAGAIADFKASKSIILNANFESNTASSTHIFIDPTPPVCSDLSGFQMQQRQVNNPNVETYTNTNQSTAVTDKEIELLFSKNKAVSEKSLNVSNSNNNVFIFPNPTTGKFSIYQNSTSNNIFYNQVKIYDPIGKTMLSVPLNEDGFMELDASLFTKGIYFIELSNKTSTSYHKLIIQ